MLTLPFITYNLTFFTKNTQLDVQADHPEFYFKNIISLIAFSAFRETPTNPRIGCFS